MEQRNSEYRARKTESFLDYSIALDVPSILDDIKTFSALMQQTVATL
jgi:hypothetical protein